MKICANAGQRIHESLVRILSCSVTSHSIPCTPILFPIPPRFAYRSLQRHLKRTRPSMPAHFAGLLLGKPLDARPWPRHVTVHLRCPPIRPPSCRTDRTSRYAVRLWISIRGPNVSSRPVSVHRVFAHVSIGRRCLLVLTRSVPAHIDRLVVGQLLTTRREPATR
jgi:hypothetical protein